MSRVNKCDWDVFMLFMFAVTADKKREVGSNGGRQNSAIGNRQPSAKERKRRGWLGTLVVHYVQPYFEVYKVLEAYRWRPNMMPQVFTLHNGTPTSASVSIRAC